MATYYHNTSEIQSDGLQTLYLMNPGYVGYSETPSNMVFLNSTGNSLNPTNLPQTPQQNPHFVGIPLQATASSSQDPTRPSPVHAQHEISAVHGFIPRLHYNLWTPSLDPTAGNHHQIPTTTGPDMTAQLGLRRSLAPPQQGLSLTLSSQQPGYGSYRPESDPPVISPARGDSTSAVSNGVSGLQSVLMGSKYLKAAQNLLDEVVSVGKGINSELGKGNKGQMKMNKEHNLTEVSGGGETSTKRGAELTTAERQELQMKKGKLVGMLDEVEQRYRQYHNQMQIVVSSFEAVAGLGSAKTYTALALQTISKQFRCLRDAISGQIRATSKSLGEEDCLGGKAEGSRLKFVDNHLRQQRALQQLGMIQHNAWRPQRGLPERSVSVLRAWLFEHFLHPYPKDSDKHMLANQTGLTRSQVSNWFINARVRLWKPMVEEMYMEETKEHEQNCSDDKTSKNEANEELASKSVGTQENSPTRTEAINMGKNGPKAPPSTIPNSPNPSSTMGNARTQASFSLIGSLDTQGSFHNKEGILQGNPKKARNNELQISNTTALMSNDLDLKSDEAMKFGTHMQNPDGYSLMANHEGGFGAYQIGEIGRFDPKQFAPRFQGNGVSLTLGLPHCENLSMSGPQQSYLSNQNLTMGRRVEMANEPNDFCTMNSPTGHSANAYENLSIQNRKRFIAQLLPDYVA
ncbi:BEL1-like homeodomain protein 1 [Tasmannia lanceolata]|uniref:BEL1-like homeodomain protein 1 n=1 Tax=Tasmannia lanceolata TaxID=3420 RepID=UPI004063FBFC